MQKAAQFVASLVTAGAAAAAQTFATTTDPATAAVAGAFGAVAGFLGSRANSQYEEIRADARAKQNHHIKFAVAAALRLSLADSKFSSEHSELFRAWELLLIRAQHDPRWLDWVLPGDHLEEALRAANPYNLPRSRSSTEAVAGLSALLRLWLAPPPISHDLDRESFAGLTRFWTDEVAAAVPAELTPRYQVYFSAIVNRDEDGLLHRAFETKSHLKLEAGQNRIIDLLRETSVQIQKVQELLKSRSTSRPNTAAIDPGTQPTESSYSQPDKLLPHIRLSLIAHGLPTPHGANDSELDEIAAQAWRSRHGTVGHIAFPLCPADQRIEDFLAVHFRDLDLETPLKLPGDSLVLDQPGMARRLATPAHANPSTHSLGDAGVDSSASHYIQVAEGGVPIPSNTQATPRYTFARLFSLATSPPANMMELPFHQHSEQQAPCFLSLLIRPTICPEVPGVVPQKTMEVRVFAPGSIASCLDRVESVFGNAGSPRLPKNDASLDPFHWSGQSGCVIVAPHLTSITKKELGLPAWEDATARQRRDRMFWKRKGDKGELYNDGVPFSLSCAAMDGTIVTLVAADDPQLCLAAVDAQRSYAADLYGGVLVEDASTEILCAADNVGSRYKSDSLRDRGRDFSDTFVENSDRIEAKREYYGIDRVRSDVHYLPASISVSATDRSIVWTTAVRS